jgi:hypothetical protein
VRAHPLLYAILVQLSFLDAAGAQECKTVGDEWVWFSDHLALKVSYIVAAPEDYEYEVGTGIRANGSVWGATRVASGITNVEAYGLGSLNVRRSGNGPNFTVCVGTEKLSVIALCGKYYLGLNDCPTF